MRQDVTTSRMGSAEAATRDAARLCRTDFKVPRDTNTRHGRSSTDGSHTPPFTHNLPQLALMHSLSPDAVS